MNQFLDYLQKYNRDIEPLAEGFFSEQKKKAMEISEVAGKMVGELGGFLKGGKKLRGALVMLGYEMYGGKDVKAGLLASLVAEILHGALLIHDDIMDQDELRRGKETLHKSYGKLDPHHGVSMAITIGDLGFFLALELLNSLDLPSDRLSKATEVLSSYLVETGFGQALDLTYALNKRFNEEDVLRVHQYKTAEYTFYGPLSVGAILAGAYDENLRFFRDFAIPVGIAFQLRDDELGMFASELELGKSVSSDIREGKVTLLISKALKASSVSDRKFLRSVWGNPKIIGEEIERVKRIIRECGSLEYSQKLSRKLVRDGKKFIPMVTSNQKYQKLLSELADLGIERTN